MQYFKIVFYSKHRNMVCTSDLLASLFIVISTGVIYSASLRSDTVKGRKLSDKNVDFQKARTLIADVTNLIYQRFEFHVFNQYQFFIGSATMGDTAWEIMKYKFAVKILQPNSSFLMTFGGSSVTAGHDNYYNQSYPFVLERRLKPIFKALGVNLLVHNIAMGANGCRPSNYCYETMGGDNPDWILWEQSFNCGRDKGVFELIARVAAWNRAVIYYR